MVDALRSAWRALRPRGLVVDLQPAAIYRPRLALVADGWRREVGIIGRSPDEDVVAAHRGRQQAIAEGWFSVVVSTRGESRARYQYRSDLRWLLRVNANWHLEPTVRRRLASAWAERPAGTSLEIRRAFSLAVLRKRGR